MPTAANAAAQPTLNVALMATAITMMGIDSGFLAVAIDEKIDEFEEEEGRMRKNASTITCGHARAAVHLFVATAVTHLLVHDYVEYPGTRHLARLHNRIQWRRRASHCLFFHNGQYPKKARYNTFYKTLGLTHGEHFGLRNETLLKREAIHELIWNMI
ncbi:hypothetical protein TSMEX_002828 [Taenia solium]|eukprot:TsM_001234400 transcript=TsM_001234400 gene=TsM_001234400